MGLQNMSHAHNVQPAVILSIRIRSESRDLLAELANATGRSKSFLAAEAIESYLETHSWQVKAIQKSIKKADSVKARFIDHESVSTWLDSWGTKEEQEPPE